MKRAILIIWSLLILLPLTVAQDYYKVRKQTRISTGLNESGAIPFEDGVVYITESNNVGISSPTDPQGRKLFTIFILEEGGRKRPFRDELVTQKHEGPVSFSGDYRTMVFSQQRPSVGRVDPLGLYFADNEDGTWVNERAFEFNDDIAWLFSPSLSSDGRILYFAANFDDGQGGFDIYRSRLRGGAWSKPENLGPEVNTPDNEVYPYIHSSGRLYFSSDGHDKNVAGFDLFQTAFVGGKWAPAIKLGAPFNTLSNEYQIWYSDDFKSGYLTSDRRSGSKDIYTFETDIPVFASPEPIKRTYYKWRIFDKKLDTVDTNLFRYSWVINDTLEVPGHDIIYKFPKPGIYNCVLNVFDIQMDTLLEPQTFRTLPIKLNEQAVITCPDTIVVNTPVEFDGSNSYLPDFNIGRYIWEFGDGVYGEGLKVTHSYLFPGKYRIMLGVEERRKSKKEDPDLRVNYKDILVVPSGQ